MTLEELNNALVIIGVKEKEKTAEEILKEVSKDTLHNHNNENSRY